MRKSTTLTATAVAVASIILTACGSSPGGGGGGGGSNSAPASSGSDSAAQTAAKALGIDLSKCPTDATTKFGATASVGQSLPLSGPLAPALGAPIGAGLKAVFAYNNATDGLATKFNLVQLDDQFTPDKALTNTQQLIAQNKVVAMTSIVGTPQVLAVSKLLTSDCVPLLPAVSNGAAVNSPSQYPWTAVDSLPSAVDVQAIIDHISSASPNGAKVAMIYSDDASGTEYLAAVKRDIAKTKSTLVSSQSIEDADTAAPSSQVTTMKASGATVLIAAPSAAQFTSLFTAVAGDGWKPAIYASSAAPTVEFDAAGAAANGVYYNQYLKDPARAPGKTDPDVLAWEKLMKQYNPSGVITQTSLAGFIDGTFFWKAAIAASKSPLGLSRLGLIEAATTLNYQSPLQPTGVKTVLNGLTDQVAIESTLMGQYNSASKTFANVKLYDYEGKMTGLASVK
jgi:branched-chain amino acid transport system substrate-binding protein